MDVKASQEVTLHCCCPLFISGAAHFDGFQRFSAQSFFVYAEFDCLGVVGREQAEGGGLRCVLHLLELLCGGNGGGSGHKSEE